MQLWVWFLFNPAWCFQANPHNYDAWFDYLRLVESDAEAETVREVYERAIANVPPVQEKRHWKRYIYLWINYALYEELEAKVQSGSWPRGAAPLGSRLAWVGTDNRGALTTQEFLCTFLQASLQPFTFFLPRFKLSIPVVGTGEVVFSFDFFFLHLEALERIASLFIVARVFS